MTAQVQHIIKNVCPVCQKPAYEKTSTSVAGKRYVVLHCGHAMIHEGAKKAIETYESIVSNKLGFKLLPFQPRFARMMEKSDFRCLLNLEMGLGKTIISLALLRLHPEMLPAMILCKAKLRRQWFAQILEWMPTDEKGKPKYLTQIISGGNQKPTEGFDVYICGLDMLRNVEWLDKTPEIKTIIIDETQMIKGHTAARTDCVRKLCKDKPYVIGMSGTPIKNNAGEFFPIFNILYPERFRDLAKFYGEWIDAFAGAYGRVKASGIKRSKLAEWIEMTSKFIFSGTREELAPELPRIFRQYHYSDLAAEVQEAYEREFEGFTEAYDEYEMGGHKSQSFANVLAFMTRMKYLTGMSKIEPTVDQVADFLMEHPGKKIVIFHHHHDVGNLLELKLQSLCADGGFEPPLRLKEGLSDEVSDKIVKSFQNDPSKLILIARTLAEGEGLNLQIASDCILMEREWNPPNEEQAEARFPRPGSTASRVNANYMVAVGTIDEFLAELVERKRAIIAQVKGQGDGNYENSPMLKELADVLYRMGRKKWTWKSA